MTHKERYFQAIKKTLALDVVAKGHANTDDIMVTMMPDFVAVTSEKEPIGDILSKAWPQDAEKLIGQKEIHLLYPVKKNRAERRRKK
jgi:hypothetical protein